MVGCFVAGSFVLLVFLLVGGYLDGVGFWVVNFIRFVRIVGVLGDLLFL